MVDTEYDYIDKKNLNEKLEKIKSLVKDKDEDIEVIMINKEIGRPFYNILLSEVEDQAKKQQRINSYIRYSYLFMILVFVGLSSYFVLNPPDVGEWKEIGDYDFSSLHGELMERIGEDEQKISKILSSLDESDQIDLEEYIVDTWLGDKITQVDEKQEETTEAEEEPEEDEDEDEEQEEDEEEPEEDEEDEEDDETEPEDDPSEVSGAEQPEEVEITQEQEEVHQQLDESEDQQIEATTVANINLRQGPWTDNSRILTIPSGTPIQINDYAFSEDEAWYQTSYQWETWWISWIGIDDPNLFED